MNCDLSLPISTRIIFLWHLYLHLYRRRRKHHMSASQAYGNTPRSYNTITCGAPAAHCYGFKDGKGVRQLKEDLAQCWHRLHRENHSHLNFVPKSKPCRWFGRRKTESKVPSYSNLSRMTNESVLHWFSNIMSLTGQSRSGSMWHGSRQQRSSWLLFAVC